LVFLFLLVFRRVAPLLFMKVKDDTSLKEQIIFHAEKCSNRPLPGAISQIVHWEIEKGGVYSEFS